MPAMNDPRKLFLHELGDVLYVEQMLVKTLPTLQKEAKDPELAKGFREHLSQTKRHVSNVEQAFRRLGEKPTARRCPGFDGIKREHDTFVSEESPSPPILDTFLTGAGARTEHYEIAAYEGLVTAARAMGEKQVAELLEQNLSDEKATLQKLKTIGRRLQREGARSSNGAARSRSTTRSTRSRSRSAADGGSRRGGTSSRSTASSRSS
jgi:ferritin-like metal-binding protein YciE